MIETIEPTNGRTSEAVAPSHPQLWVQAGSDDAPRLVPGIPVEYNGQPGVIVVVYPDGILAVALPGDGSFGLGIVGISANNVNIP